VTYSSTITKIKTEPSAKKQWQPCSGIVKASCCVNFSHQKQQSTATLEKLGEANKQKRPGQLTTGGFCMMEHDLTLQPRQRPGCKSRSEKFCSIHHIVLI
jgi:hypothetical protein